MDNRRKFSNRGFTLVEALVLIFLIVVVAVTFFSVFSSGTKGIIDSKKKLAAAEVANEKMETVRSLDYDDIGTTAGIVRGVLPEREVVSWDSGTYYVFTSVQYVDDPYDGTSNSDTTGTNDYKKVRIKAAWEDDINSNNSVVLVSNFAPPGIETNAGGGTLSINVLDSDMKSIGQANVHIVNSVLGIDTRATTDNTGNIIFPATPAGDKNYSIEVSKNGYFTVKTYSPYPTSSFSPIDVHASVLDGQLTMVNLYTDKSSNLTVQTQDPFSANVGNVGYSLEGGKKIGDTAATPSVPVYAYKENLNSGSSGENKIADLSSGTYTFTFNAVSGYEFLKLNPIDTHFTENNKFILSAGTDWTQKAIFASKTLNSLLVTVQNKTDSKPIKGASVEVKNSLPTAYDKTLTTDDYGQAYFPDNLPELAAGAYTISVSADGFANKNDTTNVSQLTKKTIQLIAQ